jgi:hypothetical protein
MNGSGYLVAPGEPGLTACRCTGYTTGSRVIQVSGAITIGQLPQLFNSLLKPLNSQNPTDFTISIEATVRYDKDPGSAFDATLKDSFRQEQFPNIKIADRKGR